MVMRISSSNLKAMIDGVEYQWFGGHGCVLTSVERGLKHGEVRMIGGQLLYVWRIDPRPLRAPLINWGRHDVSNEWLRAFRAAIFNA